MGFDNGMQVSVKPNTYLYLVLLLLLVPLPWLQGWVMAVAFHELCHYLTVKLCGGRVFRLVIGVSGAVMESSTLPPARGLFCILSGPVGGLLLLFLAKWLPRTALCSFALSVYNLLPLLPLDGGHALQILLRNERAFSVTQKVFLLLMTFGALFLTIFMHLGILPILFAAILWIKNRNSPCNQRLGKVQ